MRRDVEQLNWFSSLKLRRPLGVRIRLYVGYAGQAHLDPRFVTPEKLRIELDLHPKG